MSASTTKVLVPPPVAVPRGAVWASASFAALSRIGQAMWRGLQAAGQARARRELLRLADLHADQPEFARQLREAAHRAAMHGD